MAVGAGEDSPGGGAEEVLEEDGGAERVEEDRDLVSAGWAACHGFPRQDSLWGSLGAERRVGAGVEDVEVTMGRRLGKKGGVIGRGSDSVGVWPLAGLRRLFTVAKMHRHQDGQGSTKA